MRAFLCSCMSCILLLLAPTHEAFIIGFQGSRYVYLWRISLPL